MANPDAPGLAARPRSNQAHVPAEIHEAMSNPRRLTNSGCSISGIFLADTAKVELHTRDIESQLWLRPSDLIEPDPREDSGDVVFAGNTRRAKSQTVRNGPDVMSNRPPLRR